MSTPNSIRKKIAILGKPYVKEVIYDAVEMFLYEVLGHPEEERLVETVGNVTKELENRYKHQLPKKQPKEKYWDLEDMIKVCKEEDAKQLKKTDK